MSDSISQDEIDLLIKGGLTPARESGATGHSASTAPAADLTRALEQFLSEAAKAGSSLLGDSLGYSGYRWTKAIAGSVGAQLGDPPYLAARVGLSGSVTGVLYLGFGMTLAEAMVTQLYGGTKPASMGDQEVGALAEGVGQMAGAGLTVLTGLIGGTLTPEPARVVSDLTFHDAAGLQQGEGCLVGYFTAQLGVVSGPVVLVVPETVAQQFSAQLPRHEAVPVPGSDASAGPASVAAPAAGAVAMAAAAATPMAPPRSHHAPGPAEGKGGAVAVQPVAFRDLSTPHAQPAHEGRNLDLLLDVTLEVTVELGRTRKRIRDVLGLGPGSIVEIDKLAGEQVDVLVNGKLIAKGEVVIIDDNYGVRISDIISPAERVQTLNR